MGRSPCCSKEGLNRGAWTAAEDKMLRDYIKVHGEGRWRNLPKRAGLMRCGKSCRLRWLNYLRPDIKRGNISHDEDELIIRLHKLLGNRWSLIAGRLPGRTDNEIKNYWNTNLGKKINDQNSTASARKNSNQSSSDKKIKTNPQNESPVVRTKAVRCSKTFITASPQPHKAEVLIVNNTAASGKPAADQGTSMVKPLLESSPYINGVLIPSSTPEEDNPPMNFLQDVSTGDFCWSDLLNSSDFMGLCEFNCRKDDSNDLSPSSDGSLIFSKDMLGDWTVNNFLQPNGFASLIESGGDWLAE